MSKRESDSCTVTVWFSQAGNADRRCWKCFKSKRLLTVYAPQQEHSLLRRSTHGTELEVIIIFPRSSYWTNAGPRGVCKDGLASQTRCKLQNRKQTAARNAEPCRCYGNKMAIFVQAWLVIFWIEQYSIYHSASRVTEKWQQYCTEVQPVPL